MGLLLVEPPETLPVTLEEAKAHLNVSFDDDDAKITGMIAAATTSLDAIGWLGRCMVPQTWDYYADAFPTAYEGYITLPLPPLISVESVTYRNADGDDVVMNASEYRVDNDGWVQARIYPITTWPSTPWAGSVRIRFRAGYASGTSPDSPGDPAAVPAALKHAVLVMVRDLYDIPGEHVVGVNASNIHTIDRLIGPYRVVII